MKKVDLVEQILDFDGFELQEIVINQIKLAIYVVPLKNEFKN